MKEPFINHNQLEDEFSENDTYSWMEIVLWWLAVTVGCLGWVVFIQWYFF